MCAARPENVGTHGRTHGEHAQMTPQEVQYENEMTLTGRSTAFAPARSSRPVKGATRRENVFHAGDAARIKKLRLELEDFDYETNSFVHERFNEARDADDDYPGDLDSFVYGRVYSGGESDDDEELRVMSMPDGVAFIRGDVMVQVPDRRGASATLKRGESYKWNRGEMRWDGPFFVEKKITREEALWAVGRSDGFRALIGASVQQCRSSQGDKIIQDAGRYYGEGIEVHSERDYEYVREDGKRRFKLPDGSEKWPTLTLCAGAPPSDDGVAYTSESSGYARR